MGNGFTKLFNSLITSTVWQEDNDTRIMWITLLALADFEGKVCGSVPGIANLANIPVEVCEKALKKLSEPDKYSRSTENEGKRIKTTEDGWQILNYAKYRNKKVDRKAYLRQKQREHREKERNKEKEEKANTHTHTHTHSVNEASTKVDRVFTHNLQQVKDACVVNGIPESNAQGYFDHFNAQDWLRANKLPIANLQSHIARMWNKTKQGWVFDSEEAERETKPSVKGKYCYRCGSSERFDGRTGVIWRERLPWCSTTCYEKWIKEGKPKYG